MIAFPTTNKVELKKKKKSRTYRVDVIKLSSGEWYLRVGVKPIFNLMGGQSSWTQGVGRDSSYFSKNMTILSQK